MIAENLSLHHLVYQPKIVSGEPPLLIFLHGIGSNEHDLFELAPSLDERLLILSTRAPLVFQGDGNAGGSYLWFNVDFTSLQINLEEAEASRKTVVEFILQALRAYDADPARVYLIGFSQGATIACSVMLTAPELLAGVIPMSGRILPEVKAFAASPERLKHVAVLWTHGLYDEVLPIAHGRAARDYLSALGVNLAYREYAMGHEVGDRCFADIRTWLSVQLDQHNQNM